MSKLLKCISRNIQTYAQDAAFIALKSYEGDVKFRVHNKGLNSRGSQIGNYRSGDWIQERLAAGKQVRYVDLQFSGQTRDDLTTGQSKGQAVLGFTTDRSKEIHDENTDRYGNIWRPTTIELRDYEDRFSDELNVKIAKCG